ncbi:MAG: adenylosuccinate lyase [Phototrophicaceae bacterium]
MMSIRAISPIDGRYAKKTMMLNDYFSEYALMKYRVTVEVVWLGHLSQEVDLADIRRLSDDEMQQLQRIATDFDDEAAGRIKAIESRTNHDVKAVEYYIKELLADTSLADLSEFVHFACTSEDINNLAYAMMLRDGLMDVWLQEAHELVGTVAEQAELLRDTPILARTHGQAATPTTMGKELAVYVYRWQRQLRQLENQDYLGKFSGAVGAFNAHLAAYPDADWVDIARRFVENFGLVFNPLTTQIESHDYLAETFHIVSRFNQILLDFCQDMWAYISMGYFKQRTVAGEVGSSTMPHKVNPIDFENAEANIGLSNSVLNHLAEKLMVSRLQRDLSDSSALRNIGVGIAHSHIALQSALKGVSKVDINQEAINADLDTAWAVLAEPIQTVLRKAQYPNPYEKLKELTRGVDITQADIHAFIETLPIDAADKQRLQAMTPASYIGLASDLVDFIGE